MNAAAARYACTCKKISCLFVTTSVYLYYHIKREVYMAIQNISGADSVPQGVLESSRIQNESKNTENTRTQQTEQITEENKGQRIDTTA